MKREIQAVIVIADIENSSHYAETSTSAEYNRMIREYHKIASKAVDQYSRETELEESIIVKRAHGDEVLLILHSRRLARDVSYALHLAVLLDVEWSNSRFNTKRIHEDFTLYRLRVGIGHGKISLEKSIWDQGVTPEGYAIVQTKRLEAAAGGDIHTPHILIEAGLRKYVDAIEGVSLGRTKTLPADKAKRNETIQAIRIKNYESLYHRFKKRLQSRNRYIHWFMRGLHAWSAGDFRESLKCYERAVKYRPESFKVLNNYAGILTEMGKLEKAEEICKKVIKLKPDYEFGYINMSSIPLPSSVL